VLDTVRISTTVRKSGPGLLKKGFTKSVHTRRRVGDAKPCESVYYSKIVKDGSPHFIKYLPGVEEIVVETSLPKVLHGENISLLSDTDRDRLFDTLSNRLADHVGDISRVDKWKIRGRADFCFAWDVRQGAVNHVSDYLGAFRSVSVSRMHSESIEKEATQYWFNAQRRLRLYDKYRETRDPKALGLLRFEVQYNHAKRELERYGVSDEFGAIFSWQVARSILQDWLDAIGGSMTMGDEERIARALLKVMKPSAARRVMGSLVYRRLFTSAQLEELHFPKAMISRDTAALTGEGLSRGVAEKALLPPLTLPPVGEYAGAATKVFA